MAKYTKKYLMTQLLFALVTTVIGGCRVEPTPSTASSASVVEARAEDQPGPNSAAAYATPVGFIKGHAWGYPGAGGTLNSPAAEFSLVKLIATNAEWICISFSVGMPSHQTPILEYNETSKIWSPDTQIISAIENAQNLGLKVILKPMVTCNDGVWRAQIQFLDDNGAVDQQAWDRWWTQYRECLIHYGKLAELTGCDLYCLGCEMRSTEAMEAEWRQTIAAVRNSYSGPMTYNTNFTESRFPNWCDALDILSLSAYFHIGVEDVHTKYLSGDVGVDWEHKKTVEEKKEYLDRLVAPLEAECNRFHQSVFFIETGVCSAVNASRHPWKHPNQVEQAYDGHEQEQFYQAMLETMWEKPWFSGFCWWDWPTKLYPPEEASQQINFSIYGKPAEALVTEWFSRPTPVRPISAKWQR